MIKNIGKILTSRITNPKRIGGVGQKAASMLSNLPKSGGKALDHMNSIGASKGMQRAGRTLGNRRVQGALIAGVGVSGFMSGINKDHQTSSAFLDLTLGDPNFDKHVMGKKMGVREMMAPFPGERYLRSSPGGYAAKIGPGAVGGAGIGAGFGGLGALALRGGIKKGAAGALMGGVAGGFLGNRALPGRAPLNSVVTQRTFQDAWRENRRSSSPYVDGSIAFGMYNSRLG